MNRRKTVGPYSSSLAALHPCGNRPATQEPGNADLVEQCGGQYSTVSSQECTVSSVALFSSAESAEPSRRCSLRQAPARRKHRLLQRGTQRTEAPPRHPPRNHPHHIPRSIGASLGRPGVPPFPHLHSPSSSPISLPLPYPPSPRSPGTPLWSTPPPLLTVYLPRGRVRSGVPLAPPGPGVGTHRGAPAAASTRPCSPGAGP